MTTRSPPNRRAAAAEERRQAILDAALAEFAENGFAAARLDDVAKRAGVAKGTIYLIAKDKSDLFQQVVLDELSPLIARLKPPSGGRATLDEFRQLIKLFQTEVLQTRRKLIAQIIIKEAGRFPEIAEFHYRAIVSKMIGHLGEIANRAREDGLLRADAYARFPELIVAPLLLTLVWDANFAKIAPLDIGALLAAHFEALFGEPFDEETPR